VSGCDAQHDLAALMRSTSKHLVGNTSFFQREHSTYLRNQLSPVKQFRYFVQSRCSHIHIKVRGSNAMTFLRRLGNR